MRRPHISIQHDLAVSNPSVLARLAPDADDDEFHDVVAWATDGPREPEEIAELASRLADSGARIRWDRGPIADVASTGGPGSLSTLATPLMLRALGCRVVKLAVPGRPAGAIDALGTLPGYRTRLAPAEVREVTNECGFSHFLADDTFAPLDARLFDYRRRTGAVNVPALAVASILSKKLAVGVQSVGLDVRVGAHGNLGTTHGEARANASLFCRTASALGIRAVAVVSGERAVAQPWIGRGEALVALGHVVGLRTLNWAEWLDAHVRQCAELVRETVPSTASPDFAEASLREQLGAHLAAQGSSWTAFERRVEAVTAQPRARLHARRSGVLGLDLAALRDVLVGLQAPRSAGVFDDPAGVQLLKPPGAEVREDEPIAVVRAADPAQLHEIRRLVEAAFSSQEAVAGFAGDDVREVVRG